IDKAGQDQVRTMVLDRNVTGLFPDQRVGADRGDLAVTDEDPSVFFIDVGGAVIDGFWLGTKRKSAAAKQAFGHRWCPSCEAKRWHCPSPACRHPLPASGERNDCRDRSAFPSPRSRGEGARRADE